MVAMVDEGYAVRCRVWRDGTLLKDTSGPTAEADVIAHITDPGTLVWVDLLDPEPQRLVALGTRLGLGATGLEDAISPHERPKVSRHGDHLAFTAYGTVLAAEGRDAADAAHGQVRLTRVSGFVLPAALVTVRASLVDAVGDTVSPLDMDGVVERWEESADLLDSGPGALLYGLFDAVVDSHFETIQALDERIETLEDDLLDDGNSSPDFVRGLYGLRKDLVQLRRVVLPMREIVNTLLRHRPESDSELARWYDDLYDHVLRAAEWTESLRDMVTTLFETNLSLQDMRLNVVMKKLAAWAAIIAVPTAITGWFGQNVPYPGFEQSTGLWMSAGLILGLSLTLYAVFKRRDWL